MAASGYPQQQPPYPPQGGAPVQPSAPGQPAPPGGPPASPPPPGYAPQPQVAPGAPAPGGFGPPARGRPGTGGPGGRPPGPPRRPEGVKGRFFPFKSQFYKNQMRPYVFFPEDHRAKVFGTAIYILILALLPQMIGLLIGHRPGLVWLDVVNNTLTITIAVLGLGLLAGYTGLLSLGHAGFFGIGAFAMAVGVDFFGDPWAGMAFGVAVAGFFGFLLAAVSGRLRGFYFTVMTLAFILFLPQLVFVLRNWTYDKVITSSGAAQGSQIGAKTVKEPLFPVPESADSLPNFYNRANFYVVVAIALVIVFLLCVAIVNSRMGRAFKAIRDSEIGARASGVSTYRFKIIAVVISAAICGLAGALHGLDPQFGYTITQQSVIDLFFSFRMVIMVVVGGLGSLAGPIIGTAIFTFLLPLPSLIRGAAGAAKEGASATGGGGFFQEISPGIVGILMVILLPGGITGALQRYRDRRRSKRAQQGQRVYRSPVPRIPEELSHPMPGSHARVRNYEPLLEIRNVSKYFGGLRALASVDLTVLKGTVHSLIGPNGSGKTTMINVISGFYKEDDGKIILGRRGISDLTPDQRANIGIARTFQNMQIWRRMTVVENVMVGLHSVDRNEIEQRFGSLGRMWRARRAWGLLEFVGLRERGNDLASALSYADQRRLEIARALASNPELLLLDEPAAGMNPAEVEDLVELIDRIREEGVTVLLVEHHMDLVMDISDHLTVLDYGRRIADGPPHEVRQDPKVIEAYLGAEAL